MEPNLVLSLPEGVIQTLIVEWLSVQCLCGFDSALCNRSLRRDYMELLECGTVINDGMPVRFLEHCEPYFRWVLKKGILTRTADFTDNMMVRLVPNILRSHAKVLDWVSCHDFSAENSLSFASQLCESSCKLRRLHLVGGDWTESLKVILSQHHSLRRLHLVTSEQITSRSFSGMSVLNLRTLSVVDTHISDDAAAMMAPLLAAQLVRLQFKRTTGNDVISDEGLRHFAQCTRLLALGVVGHSVTDDAVISVVSMCPSLLYVDVSNCASLTDQTLTAIATHNPLLERLYIHSNAAFTPLGLNVIAANCRHLDTLHCADCVSITGQSIVNVMQKCSQMCALYLDGISCRLSEADVVRILQHGGNLIKLCLYSSALSNAVLSAISSCCGNVSDLGLHAARTVDPAGMFAVAKRCTKLDLLLTPKGLLSPLEVLLWKDKSPRLDFSNNENDLLQYNILVELS